MNAVRCTEDVAGKLTAYLYGVLDTRDTPPALVEITTSRPDARRWIDGQDEDPIRQRALRVRRGRLTFF